MKGTAQCMTRGIPVDRQGALKVLSSSVVVSLFGVSGVAVPYLDLVCYHNIFFPVDNLMFLELAPKVNNKSTDYALI